MTKRFRAWDVGQAWLLPPSIQDLVPEDHPAHFIRELVREDLDLSAIVEAYEGERGQQAGAQADHRPRPISFGTRLTSIAMTMPSTVSRKRQKEYIHGSAACSSSTIAQR